MSSQGSQDNGLQTEFHSPSIYKSDEVGAKLTRLDERVVATITDIDGLFDEEVSDDDKTYIKYHLYRVHVALQELTES